jgi:hypothetical protein
MKKRILSALLAIAFACTAMYNIFAVGVPTKTQTERKLTTADLEISASSDGWGTAATMINAGVWFHSVGGEASLSVDITIRAKTNIAISKIIFTANKDGNSNVITYPNKIVFGGGNTATEAKSNPLLKGPNNGSSTITDAYTNGYSTLGGKYTYSFDYPIKNTFVNLNMEGANYQGYAIFQINGAEIYGYDLDDAGSIQINPVSVKSVLGSDQNSAASIISGNGGNWTEAYNASNHPQLDFDFNLVKSINSIRFTPKGNYQDMPMSFKIYKSADGIDYGTQIAVFTNYKPVQPISADTVISFDSEIDTRYLRVEFYNAVNSSTNVGISKIGFFLGLPAAAEIEHSSGDVKLLTSAEFSLIASSTQSEIWSANNLVTGNGWWMSSFDVASADLTIAIKKNIAVTKIEMQMNAGRNMFPTQITFGSGKTLEDSKVNAISYGPNESSLNVSTVTNDLTETGHPSRDYTYNFSVPINMDFVNLHMTGGMNGDNFGIYQLYMMKVWGYEVGTVSDTKILQYSAASNDNLPNHSADNLLEGNSYWSSGVVSGTSAFVDINFGTELPLNGMKLYPRSEYCNFPQNYKLYTSSDGINYTKLEDTYTNNKPLQPRELSPVSIKYAKTIETKYLRIEFSSSSSNNNTFDVGKLEFYKLEPFVSKYPKIPSTKISISGDQLNNTTMSTAKLTDANKENMWSSNVNAGEVSLNVTFEKMYALNEVLFFGRMDKIGFPANIKFKISSDAATWSDLPTPAKNKTYTNLLAPLPGYSKPCSFTFPVATKYLQILVSGGNDGANAINQLAEIEFYGSEIEQTIGGKIPVTKCVAIPVSDALHYSGANLIDGKTDNLWDSGQDPQGEISVTFTLNGRYNVERLKMFGRGDYVNFPAQIKLQSSLDGNIFSDIPGAVFDTAQYQPYNIPVDIKIPNTVDALELADAYYIRIVVTNFSEKAVQFTEVELYGNQSSTPLTSSDTKINIMNSQASSVKAGSSLSNLFDTNNSTVWASDGNDTNPQITLKFDGYYNFSNVILSTGNNSSRFPHNFKIEYSLDCGKTFIETTFTDELSSEVIANLKLSTLIRANCLRITILDTSVTLWEIGELKLRGEVDSNQRQPDITDSIIGDIVDGNIY